MLFILKPDIGNNSKAYAWQLAYNMRICNFYVNCIY